MIKTWIICCPEHTKIMVKAGGQLDQRPLDWNEIEFTVTKGGGLAVLI